MKTNKPIGAEKDTVATGQKRTSTDPPLKDSGYTGETDVGASERSGEETPSSASSTNYSKAKTRVHENRPSETPTLREEILEKFRKTRDYAQAKDLFKDKPLIIEMVEEIAGEAIDLALSRAKKEKMELVNQLSGHLNKRKAQLSEKDSRIAELEKDVELYRALSKEHSVVAENNMNEANRNHDKLSKVREIVDSHGGCLCGDKSLVDKIREVLSK